MSIDQSISAVDSAALFEKSISDHWRLFQAEGIILILLGLTAIIISPLLTAHAATIVLGWLFLIGGATGLLSAFETQQAPGFGWSLLSAVAAMLAGGVLLWNPWQGSPTLSYVLIAFFNVDGILLMMLALQLRLEATPGWLWIMISGALDVVLAAIIIAGATGTVAWTMGLLVGIDLVWGGVSLIIMAHAARDAADLIRPVITREGVRRAQQPAHCFPP
ncbi:MAG TPA: HdeD family acid-resistance protein [Stellaceae bacterium]|nr:HdeD family acid-resistance protein [Stellaceae bacterium]